MVRMPGRAAITIFGHQRANHLGNDKRRREHEGCCDREVRQRQRDPAHLHGHDDKGISEGGGAALGFARAARSQCVTIAHRITT